MNAPDSFDTLLREGLRDLPTPAASPGFDSAVLAALQRPRTRWQLLWDTARPVLGGAVCSLTLMLALLHWIAQAPIVPPRAEPVAANSRPIDMIALQKALERPGLTVGSLARLSAEAEFIESPPAVKPPPPAIDRPRGPIRHAWRTVNSHALA